MQIYMCKFICYKTKGVHVLTCKRGEGQTGISELVKRRRMNDTEQNFRDCLAHAVKHYILRQ